MSLGIQRGASVPSLSFYGTVTAAHRLGIASACNLKGMTHPRETLKCLSHSAQNHCFGCGPANPTGLHLEFQIAEDVTVVCQASIGSEFDGHPGYLHGGIIATLLDEAMSKAVRARGVTAMTRKLEAEYLHPVPSGAMLRIEGRHLRAEGKKHWVEAKILDEADAELARGTGLFIAVRIP